MRAGTPRSDALLDRLLASPETDYPIAKILAILVANIKAS
jgi:hypothetical protein